MDTLAVKALEWRLYTQAAISHIFIAKLWRTIASIIPGRAPRPGFHDISARWMTAILRRHGLLGYDNRVVSVQIADLSGNRGLQAAIHRLTIKYEIPQQHLPQTLVLKTTQCHTLGFRVHCLTTAQYREALFYAKFSQKKTNVDPIIIPEIYYTYGSAFSGDGVILMEDLKNRPTTGVNFFFGNQIWGMEPLPANLYREPSAVLHDVFGAIAKVHARYWNSQALLKEKWLKSVQWYQGKNKAHWLLALKCSQRAWHRCKATMSESDVKWSSFLIDIIDQSYHHSTWERVQEQLQDESTPYTLTHGDFHAANMFWVHDSQDLLMVDWSEAGVWEPTTELGQMMISDVKVDVRRKCERQVVRNYWESLTRNGVSRNDYTFEHCWNSYRRFAVERWIWMFCLLASMNIPAAAVQYFHDQLLAFIQDHGDGEPYVIKPVILLG